jgi:hypothetical protein
LSLDLLCLILPWITTLWLIRRFGYQGHAAEIVAEGNQKMGWDGERIMRWFVWGVIVPVAFFNVLAVPVHLSVGEDAVRVTHYAHLRPEVFRFEDARGAYTTDGYLLRDGSFQTHPDLFIDFADGRRLDANAVGDGGTVPPQKLVNLLLARTHLEPAHVRTESDIRPGA